MNPSEVEFGASETSKSVLSAHAASNIYGAGRVKTVSPLPFSSRTVLPCILGVSDVFMLNDQQKSSLCAIDGREERVINSDIVFPLREYERIALSSVSERTYRTMLDRQSGKRSRESRCSSVRSVASVELF